MVVTAKISRNFLEGFSFCLSYAFTTVLEHHSHNQKLPVCWALQLPVRAAPLFTLMLCWYWVGFKKKKKACLISTWVWTEKHRKTAKKGVYLVAIFGLIKSRSGWVHLVSVCLSLGACRAKCPWTSWMNLLCGYVCRVYSGHREALLKSKVY